MQNSSLLSDVNQSKKSQITKLFYSSDSLPSLNKNKSQKYRRSSSKQFIPFLNERDSMGKLIGSIEKKRKNEFAEDSKNRVKNHEIGELIESKIYQQFTNTNKSHILHGAHQINSSLNGNSTLKASTINEVVNYFFKRIDIETRQLSRSSFPSPQPQIQILKKSPRKIQQQQLYNTHQSYDINDVLNKFNKISGSRLVKNQPSYQKVESNKQKSHNLYQTLQTNSLKQKQQVNSSSRKLLRYHSMFERNQSVKKLQPNLKNKNVLGLEKQREGHKKSQSLINSLKVKLNPEQPQYKRYKKQQQSALKIFEDYEQGHQKFRQKMKQSKQNAYNIKKQLQID